MTLVQTILFVPKGESEVIRVEIYVSYSSKFSQGFWNVDDNKIILSPDLYQQYKSCNTQSLKRKFFDQLKKVSQTLIS